MPSLKLSVPHSLDRADAHQRLVRFLEQVKEMYGDKLSHLEEDWQEFTGSYRLKAMGMSSEGTVVVEETEVRIDGKLPLAALVFKGQIEETIRKYLTRVLS